MTLTWIPGPSWRNTRLVLPSIRSVALPGPVPRLVIKAPTVDLSFLDSWSSQDCHKSAKAQRYKFFYFCSTFLMRLR